MSDRLVELFSNTLNVPAEAISDDTSPNNTDAWDSLANMLLVAAIEETFEITLSTSEIGSMSSVGKVRTVLSARSVSI